MHVRTARSELFRCGHDGTWSDLLWCQCSYVHGFSADQSISRQPHSLGLPNEYDRCLAIGDLLRWFIGQCIHLPSERSPSTDVPYLGSNWINEKQYDPNIFVSANRPSRISNSVSDSFLPSPSGFGRSNEMDRRSRTLRLLCIDLDEELIHWRCHQENREICCSPERFSRLRLLQGTVRWSPVVRVSFCAVKVHRTIVTGGHDGVIRFWDPFVTERPAAVLSGHSSSILHLVIDNREDHVISIDKGNSKSVHSRWQKTSVECHLIQTSLFGMYKPWRSCNVSHTRFSSCQVMN